MGIPHLTALLRPYASTSLWANEAPGINLIVDGPSLAYYIYHRRLSKNLETKGNFEAIPSYDDVSVDVVAWLEALEGFGFAVYVPACQ